jgi:hypothetical protein
MGRKRTKEKRETVRTVTLEGGPLDGKELRLALPLTPRMKLDMGRAPYFLKGAGSSIYEYDPDREYKICDTTAVPTTDSDQGGVG